MITAKEARELSGPGPKEYLEYIETRIREACARKDKFVIIREQPYCTWLYSAKAIGQSPQAVIDNLRANGFKLTLYYQELQFVDMGLRISWEEQ